MMLPVNVIQQMPEAFFHGLQDCGSCHLTLGARSEYFKDSQLMDVTLGSHASYVSTVLNRVWSDAAFTRGNGGVGHGIASKAIQAWGYGLDSVAT